MWERDTKIYNLMLALRSARKGAGQRDPILSILSDLFRRLAMPTAITEKDFESLMNLTIAKIVDTIGAQAITVYLVEDKTIRFRYIYYSPTLYDLSPEQKQRFEETKQRLLQTKLEWGQGIVGQVIEHGKTIVVEEASKDSHFLRTIDEATGFVTHSMITVPIFGTENQAVGAIQVLNKVSRTGEVTKFTEEDVHLLEDVAEYSSKIFQKMVDPSFQLSDRDIAKYIGKICHLEVVEFQPEDIPEEIWKQLDLQKLEKYGIVPLEKGEEGYLVATSNPLSTLLLEKFKKDTGISIEKVYVAPHGCIRKVLETLQGRAS